MAAFDKEAYERTQQRKLSERQFEAQNDPANIFLKSLASTVPQTVFSSLGQMAVAATKWEALGGKDQFKERVRATKEVEGTNKRIRELEDIKTMGPGTVRNRMIKEYNEKYGQKKPKSILQNMEELKEGRPKQRTLTPGTYGTMAAKASGIGEDTSILATEAQALAKTSTAMSGQGQKAMQSFQKVLTDSGKNFENSSVIFGRKLKKAKTKEDKERVRQERLGAVKNFVDSLEAEISFLPIPEQARASQRIATFLSSGGIADEDRSLLNAQIIKSGGKLISGLSASKPTPSMTGSERSTYRTLAIEAQKEADLLRKQYETARALAAGKPADSPEAKQANNLLEQQKVMQKSAMDFAKISGFKLTSGDRVVTGGKEPTSKKAEQVTEIVTLFNGARDGSVAANPQAAMRKALELRFGLEPGDRLPDKAENQLKKFSALSKENQEKTFNVLISDLGPVQIFSDLEEFKLLNETKQRELTSLLKNSSSSLRTKIFRVMLQSKTDLNNVGTKALAASYRLARDRVEDGK